MRIAFESVFLPVLGNGHQTEFRFSVTPRDYLTMEVYEVDSLQSASGEEIEVVIVDGTEIVARFAAPPSDGARYTVVLGWRG